MSSPLSVSDSNIKVMNAALAVLGVEPITTFLDASLPARTGNALFLDTLEAALSSYPWRFARNWISLARVDTPPPAPWDALYALPVSALAVHTVWEDDQKVMFDVFGRRVATMTSAASAATVYAEVTSIVGPDQWPGYFRQAFVLYLAARLAMPITQDERTAAFTLQQAEGEMLRARSRDAQGRTPSRLDTKAFIRARRGGRSNVGVA